MNRFDNYLRLLEHLSISKCRGLEEYEEEELELEETEDECYVECPGCSGCMECLGLSYTDFI
jgi:hypothetical protein